MKKTYMQTIYVLAWILIQIYWKANLSGQPSLEKYLHNKTITEKES